MKRLISLVARLYPRSWRAEFGEEFDAVLDDVKPRWRVLRMSWEELSRCR